VETLNKKVTLKVSAKGLKIIDKKGIDSVIKDLMAEGRKF
jgi:large subunit ribosomal protein L28